MLVLSRALSEILVVYVSNGKVVAPLTQLRSRNQFIIIASDYIPREPNQKICKKKTRAPSVPRFKLGME